MSGLPQRPPCPCDSGRPYDDCCGPLHRQERAAASPEELMRSRYSGYALGELDHVFRTWHPRTRPDDVRPDPTTAWIGLEVLDSGDDGSTGSVHFRAHFRTSSGGSGVHEERSRFELRGGRWVYLDAEGGAD